MHFRLLQPVIAQFRTDLAEFVHSQETVFVRIEIFESKQQLLKEKVAHYLLDGGQPGNPCSIKMLALSVGSC